MDVRIMTVKYLTIISLMLSVIASACTDNNDTPPPVVDFEYGTVVGIDKVKDLYASQLAIKDYKLRTPVLIESDWAIKGIVTASDKKDGNLYKEAYIQDATGGIKLVFNATGGLYIGDSVIVNVKDLYIGDYGNFWQLGSVPYHESDGDIRVSGISPDKKIMKTSINNNTYPEVVTISQAKNTAYLGKLVKFYNVQFDDDEVGSCWADAKNRVPENHDLVDCNGNSITVRTSGYSSKAGEPLPEGNGSITGIVTIFNNTYQLIVRDFAEVDMTGELCGAAVQHLGDPVETLSVDFSGFSSGENAYPKGWQNLSEGRGRIWQGKTYGSNTYLQATGYNSKLKSMVAWLITPPIKISTQKVLTFKSAMAYWTHDEDEKPLEVFYSVDYNGSNLTAAVWHPLQASLPLKSGTNYEFIPSGAIKLPVEENQTMVIGFRYSGSSTKSTTICIDDIAVTQ